MTSDIIRLGYEDARRRAPRGRRPRRALPVRRDGLLVHRPRRRPVLRRGRAVVRHRTARAAFGDSDRHPAPCRLRAGGVRARHVPTAPLVDRRVRRPRLAPVGLRGPRRRRRQRPHLVRRVGPPSVAARPAAVTRPPAGGRPRRRSRRGVVRVRTPRRRCAPPTARRAFAGRARAIGSPSTSPCPLARRRRCSYPVSHRPRSAPGSTGSSAGIARPAPTPDGHRCGRRSLRRTRRRERRRLARRGPIVG